MRLKKAELEAECVERSLSDAGTKKDLVKRIIDHDEAAAAATASPPAQVPPPAPALAMPPAHASPSAPVPPPIQALTPAQAPVQRTSPAVPTRATSAPARAANPENHETLEEEGASDAVNQSLGVSTGRAVVADPRKYPVGFLESWNEGLVQYPDPRLGRQQRREVNDNDQDHNNEIESGRDTSGSRDEDRFYRSHPAVRAAADARSKAFAAYERSHEVFEKLIARHERSRRRHVMGNPTPSDNWNLLSREQQNSVDAERLQRNYAQNISLSRPLNRIETPFGGDMSNDSSEDGYKTPPELHLTGNFDRQYWNRFNRTELVNQIKSHGLTRKLPLDERPASVRRMRKELWKHYHYQVVPSSKNGFVKLHPKNPGWVSIRERHPNFELRRIKHQIRKLAHNKVRKARDLQAWLAKVLDDPSSADKSDHGSSAPRDSSDDDRFDTPMSGVKLVRQSPPSGLVLPSVENRDQPGMIPPPLSPPTPPNNDSEDRNDGSTDTTSSSSSGEDQGQSPRNPGRSSRFRSATSRRFKTADDQRASSRKEKREKLKVDHQKRTESKSPSSPDSPSAAKLKRKSLNDLKDARDKALSTNIEELADYESDEPAEESTLRPPRLNLHSPDRQAAVGSSTRSFSPLQPSPGDLPSQERVSEQLHPHPSFTTPKSTNAADNNNRSHAASSPPSNTHLVNHDTGAPAQNDDTGAPAQINDNGWDNLLDTETLIRHNDLRQHLLDTQGIEFFYSRLQGRKPLPLGYYDANDEKIYLTVAELSQRFPGIVERLRGDLNHRVITEGDDSD